jgi:hypothetical protein
MGEVLIWVELCPDMEILLTLNSFKEASEVRVVMEVVL